MWFYNAMDQLDWLDQLVRSLKIERAYTAGVSNGAYLAQLITVRRPELIQKGVFMAGVAPVNGKKTNMFKMMKVFLPEALFPNGKNVLRLLRKLSGPEHRVFTDNKYLLDHWTYLLKYFKPKAMTPHKYVIFDKSELEILRKKGLFLIGSEDPLCGPDSVKILAENNLNYKIIERAGHGINHEQAGKVNSEIIRFFQS
jgi:pimeloyl-ACP methyl ester carboxylesterase